MGGNDYLMQVSVCSKYWFAFLIFGASCWMTWWEANGSWKGFSPSRDQLVFQQPCFAYQMTLVCKQYTTDQESPLSMSMAIRSTLPTRTQHMFSSLCLIMPLKQLLMPVLSEHATIGFHTKTSSKYAITCSINTLMMHWCSPQFWTSPDGTHWWI